MSKFEIARIKAAANAKIEKVKESARLLKPYLDAKNKSEKEYARSRSKANLACAERLKRAKRQYEARVRDIKEAFKAAQIENEVEYKKAMEAAENLRPKSIKGNQDGRAKTL